ncbi:efflux RND transporter periplasmic adaptor subunit [Microbulbifer pacificus]|uniref:efflux RND transporter periplasmic adaptor subunit n=1 Tax=Microbulbifer pacificus TaxID=407164 RepID=UPI00131A194B|nr:HlyD family efflux transporter periplasmic adaptor subunit [Microbulbifer pacificus]
MDTRLLEKLNTFLALEKRLRSASDESQIARIACTDSQLLLAFDTCLFLSGPALTLTAASNVVAVDATASEAHHWQQLARENIHRANTQPPLQLSIPFSTAAVGAGTNNKTEILHKTLVLMPLGSARNADLGCLALLRAKALSEQEQEILRELAAAVRQAMLALRGAKRFSLRHWFRRRPLIAAGLLLGVCLLPVRQSVLAPASLAAIDPRIVSARTDGVIREINIPPNARVEDGQLLFTLEDAEVSAEIDRVQQEIALYSERLRMTRQYNFQQTSAGHKLAEAETDLAIRHLELDFQQAQLEKTRVKAPASGIATYTDPAEWIGRRIRAGEKVMEIVQPDARQIQIDLPTVDAIALPEHARTVFYAESDPLSPIEGQLHYHSLLTSEGENLPASYRLLARIEQDHPQILINTRGHARIYGARVPLIYYLLRKPLASARRWLGV